MISDRTDIHALTEAYVWIWLPGATEPVPAGRIAQEGERLTFNYGRSYLSREDRLSIYEPQLPLRHGAQMPLPGLRIAGCLRDASPDAWGRRVILNKTLGQTNNQFESNDLSELTYMLESGSNRVGALDFQLSSSQYVPRIDDSATLEQLQRSATKVVDGVPLSPELDHALFHGTSIGGARPKATIQTDEAMLIAKFSTSADNYSVVKAEYMAMRLAAMAGLNVAPVRLTSIAGKDVLLVERFDRVRSNDDWARRFMVSALTLFALDELMARYASYADLAEIVRHRFTSSRSTLRELFGRLVFNVLCGNTDDHARNHAAFWDGERLTLTPAYDICPQLRSGNIASQAMLIIGNNRSSTLANCIDAAPVFQLREQQAKEIVAQQITVIQENWDEMSNEAALTDIEQNIFKDRIFLNESIFIGASEFRN